MRPSILLTRPAAESEATGRALAKITGLPVIESPLMQVRPAANLPDLTDIAQLILTSRNGVQTYAALSGPPRSAFCVGEATAEDARAIGLDACAMGGDAATMVPRIIEAAPSGTLMHLRGEHSSGNIAQRLTEAGIPTSEAVIYHQDLLDLTAEAQAVLAARTPLILPLYSPRTAARFAELARPRAPLYLVAMSRAVERAFGDLPTRDRMIADAPDAPSMIRAVVATLRRLEGVGRPD